MFRYFEPADLGSMGIFQDGCLKHNNPIRMAMWEIERIWPPGTTTDVVVSMGTGTKPPQQISRLSSTGRLSTDRFMSRLFKSFASSIDGENRWQDVLNSVALNKRADFFRLNVVLDKEPDIDDVGALGDLREQVELQADIGLMQDVVRALLISAFYFEIDRAPVYEKTARAYRCYGRILCRGQPRRIVSALSRLHLRTLELTISGNPPQAFLPNEHVCETCDQFCYHVTFLVRQVRTEVVELGIREGEVWSRKLSGFPQTIEWFMKQQRLNSPFGSRTRSATTLVCPARCDEPSVKALRVKRRGSKNQRVPGEIKRNRTEPHVGKV